MKGIPDFPLHDIQDLKKLTCVIFPRKKREETHKSRLCMFNYFKSYKASLVLYIHIVNILQNMAIMALKIANFVLVFLFTGQKLTEHYKFSEHNSSHN